jgi:hypothetical protein
MGSSQEVNRLLTFLCFLGPVGVRMEYLGAHNRKIWDETGEVSYQLSQASGVQDELLYILSDTPVLEKCINLLLDAGNVKKSDDGSLLFVDNETSKRILGALPDQQKTHWRRQALLHASFNFPKRYLHPQ